MHDLEMCLLTSLSTSFVDVINELTTLQIRLSRCCLPLFPFPPFPPLLETTTISFALLTSPMSASLQHETGHHWHTPSHLPNPASSLSFILSLPIPFLFL